MSETTPLTKNPGFAGETGEFDGLSEEDVRGSRFYGSRPLAGGAPGGVNAYPYQLARRDPDAPLFDGPYAERLEKILGRYPDDRRGALLPVLNLAQEVHGYVAPDDMEEAGRILGLSGATVRGVATFYTMYNKRPVGRWLIQVCTNVACNLCGGDEVLEAFLDATGTEMGETTEDGLFTVMEVECLGACGFPTAVQVNDRYFENVSATDAAGILDRLRAEAEKLPEPDADAGLPTSSPRPAASTAGQTPAPPPSRAAGEASPEGTHDAEAVGRGDAAVPPAPGEPDEAAEAVRPTSARTDTGEAERTPPAGPRSSGSSQPHRPEDVGGG